MTRCEPRKPCRSKKVQQILHLEGSAARCRAQYERGLVKVSPSRHRAEQLLQEALAIKVTLTPRELSELRSARSGV